MYKAQRPTSGVATHHTTLSTSRHVWSGGIKCVEWWDGVWCAVPEMWFDVKLLSCSRWDVECTTHCHCISHHITATTFYIASHKRHLWHYSKPHHIPRRTIIPHHLAHFISHQHLSQHAIPLCNTIFQNAPYRPHHASHHWPLALHPISLYRRTITPQSMHSTPHQFQITPYIGPHH